MSQSPLITKDGISDADLIMASRDMYRALVEILESAPYSRKAELGRLAGHAAIAKARGEA